MAIYLYDPVSNTKKETTYEALIAITGKTKNNLMSHKSKRRKISCLNRYLIDEKFTKKDRYQLMCSQKLTYEIWKNISRSNGRYQVSNYGRIRRVCKNGKTKLLMPYIRHNKWLHVKVNIDGLVKEYAVHRLVAEEFIENEHCHPNTYHKNDDIYDNHADNLGWVDKKTLGKKTGHKSKSIPVLKLDPATGEVLDEYSSMAEAGRHNYLHRETIRLCVIGKLKTAGGFKWSIDTEFCSGF